MEGQRDADANSGVVRLVASLADRACPRQLFVVIECIDM